MRQTSAPESILATPSFVVDIEYVNANVNQMISQGVSVVAGENTVFSYSAGTGTTTITVAAKKQLVHLSIAASGSNATLAINGGATITILDGRGFARDWPIGLFPAGSTFAIGSSAEYYAEFVQS